MKCEYIFGIDGNTLHTKPAQNPEKTGNCEHFMAMLIFISIFNCPGSDAWRLTWWLSASLGTVYIHTLEQEFQLFSAAYCINFVKRRLHNSTQWLWLVYIFHGNCIHYGTPVSFSHTGARMPGHSNQASVGETNWEFKQERVHELG